MIEFSPTFWYWAAAVFLGFLPLELYAAKSKMLWARGGTFSEFVWWAFGIRRRWRQVPPLRGYFEFMVPFARFRRFVLAGFCMSLSAHFVLGVGPQGVVVFAPFVGGIIVYALAKER